MLNIRKKKSSRAYRMRYALGGVALLSIVGPTSLSTAFAEPTIPKEIADKGLVLGGNYAYPPQVFYENGKLVGVDIDLANATAKKLGIKVKFVDMAFEALIPSLASNRIDAAWSAMYDTPKRQEAIDLVDYYSAPWGLLVKSQNPLKLKNMTDLCGSRAALSSGSASVDLVEAQNKKCLSSGKDAIKVDVFNEDAASNLAIRANRADFNMQDFSTMAYLARITEDGKVFTAIPVGDMPGTLYGIGVSKSRPEVRQMLQAGVQAIIEDGEYMAILKKWGLEPGAISQVSVNAGK